MSALEQELGARLERLGEQHLLRRLREVSSPQSTRIVIDGRELVNFSSNDYLGLASDERVKAAAIEATLRWGAGSGASRLVCGSLRPHHELEEALSAFKGTPAALAFSSGYATALGTITALAGKEDIVVLDKLVHASIVDAARLSGAKLRIFRHNDLNDLESILQWAAANKSGQVLVITESVFSMDGDIAPLREVAALKERYGAWLMVDEAHATGLFGARRRGAAEELGVSERIDVQMGTLSKALGSSGGFVAGSRALIDYLLNKARSFVFSTAPPPGLAAAATEALRIVSSAEGASRVQKLRTNIAMLRGVSSFDSAPHSPILPLIVGGEEDASKLAAGFFEAGLFVPAIRYPSVARGKARLRFTLSSAHRAEELEAARTLLTTGAARRMAANRD